MSPGDVQVSGEIVRFAGALACVAFTAILSGIGWLMSTVGKLKTDVAVIRQRLADLPCDNCRPEKESGY